jgi:hypothetical protein
MEESKAYTLHSPRHFMPEVSRSREEPVPITILGRQMDALRAYVRTVEASGGLPAYGGWEDIPKFAPRGGDLGE